VRERDKGCRDFWLSGEFSLGKMGEGMSVHDLYFIEEFGREEHVNVIEQ